MNKLIFTTVLFFLALYTTQAKENQLQSIIDKIKTFGKTWRKVTIDHHKEEIDDKKFKEIISSIEFDKYVDKLELNFSHNKITDLSPLCHIHGSQQLYQLELNFRKNKITSAYLEDIGELEYLLEFTLDISENRLTYFDQIVFGEYEVPSTWEDYVKLQVLNIDASKNYLTTIKDVVTSDHWIPKRFINVQYNPIDWSDLTSTYYEFMDSMNGWSTAWNFQPHFQYDYFESHPKSYPLQKYEVCEPFKTHKTRHEYWECVNDEFFKFVHKQLKPDYNPEEDEFTNAEFDQEYSGYYDDIDDHTHEGDPCANKGFYYFLNCVEDYCSYGKGSAEHTYWCDQYIMDGYYEVGSSGGGSGTYYPGGNPCNGSGEGAYWECQSYKKQRCQNIQRGNEEMENYCSGL